MTELGNVQPADQMLLGSATQPLSNLLLAERNLQQPEILAGFVKANSTPNSSSLC